MELNREPERCIQQILRRLKRKMCEALNSSQTCYFWAEGYVIRYQCGTTFYLTIRVRWNGQKLHDIDCKVGMDSHGQCRIKFHGIRGRDVDPENNVIS
ncbi:hypothetical protein ACOME3_006152 [Neoechinorhynchus agilis]